jgi:hypothetical protein
MQTRGSGRINGVAMKEFPFTDDDWSLVSEAARAVVNASFAKDEVLHASLLEELFCVIADLRRDYGEHPILLETEADFAHDPSERIKLYERAKESAHTGDLLTYTIRISLARVLLEELNDCGRALKELLACGDEVFDYGDESEQKEWTELQAECARRSN